MSNYLTTCYELSKVTWSLGFSSPDIEVPLRLQERVGTGRQEARATYSHATAGMAERGQGAKDQRQRLYCESKIRALEECHRKHRSVSQRDVLCRHLNHAAAVCLLWNICPGEMEAVELLCASAGTQVKRRQCHHAKAAVEACISSHQADYV